MTTLPLTIQYGVGPAREAAAWFVAGAGPRDWLQTIAEWNVSLDTLRF